MIPGSVDASNTVGGETVPEPINGKYRISIKESVLKEGGSLLDAVMLHELVHVGVAASNASYNDRTSLVDVGAYGHPDNSLPCGDNLQHRASFGHGLACNPSRSTYEDT